MGGDRHLAIMGLPDSSSSATRQKLPPSSISSILVRTEVGEEDAVSDEAEELGARGRKALREDKRGAGGASALQWRRGAGGLG